jgi:hypothetical protein
VAQDADLDTLESFHVARTGPHVARRVQRDRTFAGTGWGAVGRCDEM